MQAHRSYSPLSPYFSAEFTWAHILCENFVSDQGIEKYVVIAAVVRLRQVLSFVTQEPAHVQANHASSMPCMALPSLLGLLIRLNCSAVERALAEGFT